MAPADFAGLVINSLDDAFAPYTVVSACPSVITVGGLSEIDAPARMCIDDKQPGLRVEAGRAEVRQAVFIGGNQAPVRRRLFGGIGDRSSLLIDAQRPVHRPEGHGQQALSVGAVEDEKVAVARSLHQHLSRL